MPGRRAPKKKIVPPVRGTRISFTGGSYAGEKGWTNASKDHTVHSIHVIVDYGQPEGDDLAYATRVDRKNAIEYAEPNSIEGFVVQEDPNVAHHLSGLATSLAAAGLGGATDELLQIMKTVIDHACVHQAEKGKKAKYSATALLVQQMEADLAAKEKANKNKNKRPNSLDNEMLT